MKDLIEQYGSICVGFIGAIIIVAVVGILFFDAGDLEISGIASKLFLNLIDSAV